jgi:hypothetical protein
MPKTFVMTYLDFAKDEGCVAALENLESIQASLECILEATDQPIHTLYASSLLTTVNDTIIVIQHIHLQELEHKIKEPGEEPRKCGQPIHQISYRCVDCIGRDG